MALSSLIDHVKNGRNLPDDVYVSFVSSLYEDPRSLLIGSVATIGTTIVAALRTGELLLFVCAVIMVLVCAARIADAWNFAKRLPSLRDAETATAWERRHFIGAATYVAVACAAFVITVATTDDTLMRLFSFASTLAYLIAVSTRHFANIKLINTQIVCVVGAGALSMAVLFDPYYAIFAALHLPLMLNLRSSSEQLRTVVLKSLDAARSVRSLANRFDAALNNIPQGLCMFDANQRLVVANRRAGELLGASHVDADADATSVLEGVQPRRILTAEDVGLPARSDDPTGIKHRFLETEDNRALAFTFEPTEEGGLVVLVEDVTDRRNNETAIARLARYDALTKLPNLTLLREEMDRMRAQGLDKAGRCAVFGIGLDHFKLVNEAVGRANGDVLLCEVAERLRAIVRQSDLIARVGGDEFIIVQSPLKRVDQAELFAKRIIAILAEPFVIGDEQVNVTASVGVAMTLRDRLDPDVLLRNADMALSHAKTEGPSSSLFFDESMDIEAQARRTMETELRSALADGALEIFYQPLFNLQTQTVNNFEALLRWFHPERGAIAPADFIPVAEQIGVIVEIGNWVLREACLECKKWPEDVRVAVNLSPTQLKRGDLINTVKKALALAGLSANRLELEITEHALVEDSQTTRETLGKLRDMGVRISLDDFGTGYSSLSYLHSFPLSKVKIDRSFVEDVGSSERSLTLLRGVARLSSELGLAVVVEGVETMEQLRLITGDGTVNEVQGHLFSPAAPSSQVPMLLDISGASKAAA